jgi:hypothetical protein
MTATALHPSELDTLTRAQAETVAARVLRAVAAESLTRHRDKATAARECAQLIHLAVRLESYAKDA